jgi:hypothetical protein
MKIQILLSVLLSFAAHAKADFTCSLSRENSSSNPDYETTLIRKEVAVSETKTTIFFRDQANIVSVAVDAEKGDLKILSYDPRTLAIQAQTTVDVGVQRVALLDTANHQRLVCKILPAVIRSASRGGLEISAKYVHMASESGPSGPTEPVTSGCWLISCAN